MLTALAMLGAMLAVAAAGWAGYRAGRNAERTRTQEASLLAARRAQEARDEIAGQSDEAVRAGAIDRARRGPRR